MSNSRHIAYVAICTRVYPSQSMVSFGNRDGRRVSSHLPANAARKRWSCGHTHHRAKAGTHEDEGRHPRSQIVRNPPEHHMHAFMYWVTFEKIHITEFTGMGVLLLKPLLYGAER